MDRVGVAWALLALLHGAPALTAFVPGLVQRLYGTAPHGELGVLLVSRGVLFVAVFVAAVFAMVDPSSRRLASVVVGISMVGFLLVYARAGMPAGSLRKIAIADLVGLGPLAWVVVDAWF